MQFWKTPGLCFHVPAACKTPSDKITATWLGENKKTEQLSHMWLPRHKRELLGACTLSPRVAPGTRLGLQLELLSSSLQ
ncbi:hypothetical protein Y1Q_0019659 [Alligator mississippiensis]|uniref:Uncharacterized protein n=1 Tax=Alligator mississippiensis TaxID=8496 RepID=A0A151PFI2_ALLMI|nr:hypothetical protein Y1Q_0019659 [Alligator mississippiensis]